MSVESKTCVCFELSQGHTCPAAYNPADFFIRTLAMMPGCEESSRLAVRKICDRFAVSEFASEIDVTVQLEIHMGSSYEVRDHINECQR